jgi:outer membrane lipoprotein-sorting protein
MTRRAFRSAIVCAAVCAAALLWGSAASAQANPDPLAILKAVGDAYSTMRTYHLVSTTEVSPADHPGKVVIGEVVAGASNGRTHFQMSTPSMTVRVVSDGTTSWTYFPQRNEYFETPADASPFPTVADLLENYKNIRRISREATWLRAETVTFDGHTVECDVVRVARVGGEAPDGAPQWQAEWMSALTTHWIDRASHRILRTTAVTERGGTVDTVYTVVRLNEDVASELFDPVPAGAKKIEPPR